MAGDWLKVEHATPDKPEIYQIAGELNLDPEAVFTKCIRVWIWFDVHSEDGTAPVTLRALLDRTAGVTGFAIAMQNAHWLKEIEVNGQPRLLLPNFDRHVGKSAKTRALTSRRVAKHKKVNAESNADSVSVVTPKPLADALPREEKRRVKDKKENIKRKKTGFTDKTFQPEWIEEARQKPKYANLNLEAEQEKFSLHHGAKGSTFVEWKLAWWNWLNNALEFQKGKPDSQDWRSDLKRMADEAIRLGNAA